MIALAMSEDRALRPFQFVAFAFLSFAPAGAVADPVISPLATARPVVAKLGLVVTM
jgi:hypothetical protein